MVTDNMLKRDNLIKLLHFDCSRLAVVKPAMKKRGNEYTALSDACCTPKNVDMLIKLLLDEPEDEDFIICENSNDFLIFRKRPSADSASLKYGPFLSEVFCWYIDKTKNYSRASDS